MKIVVFLLLALALARPAAAQFMYFNHANSRLETTHPLSLSGPLWANTDLTGVDVRTAGWFRNYDATQGLYAQAYAAYFYAATANRWVIGGGNAPQELVFRDTLGGTVRGYFYSDAGNIGFRNSNNLRGLYVPLGSSRVHIPSPLGMQIGTADNRITSIPEVWGYGNITLATKKGGYYGILMGQTNTAPNLMFQDNTYGGVFVQGTGSWKILWNLDTSPKQYGVTGKLYTSGASYTIRDSGRRVLTKVVTHTLAVGRDNTAWPPDCPDGSWWSSSGCAGYACWNECTWGSGTGWGGTE
jgi:hypothetical protein